ncbi:MAG: hypothetical protein ABSA32_12875 [Candidatus Acidiferrales bacterium]
MRHKAIAILALSALLLGAIPDLTSALLAMPPCCACCQSKLCPMHRSAESSGRPLCSSHPLSQAGPCNMECCQPQSMHALSGTPFVLTAPNSIFAPAIRAVEFLLQSISLLSAAREVTPPPPKTILA